MITNIKGSQYQMQRLSRTDGGNILRTIDNRAIKIKKWLSPISDNNYKEYCFPFRPFQELIKDNTPFEISDTVWQEFGWPKKGKSPTLDGIALSENNTLVIVEAKSYPTENNSSTKEKKQIEIIEKCLMSNNVNPAYVRSKYYQVANRVATLKFLNSIGVQTELVYICFYNDLTHNDSKNIVSKNDWKKAISKMKEEVPDLSSSINFCLVEGQV